MTGCLQFLFLCSFFSHKIFVVPRGSLLDLSLKYWFCCYFNMLLVTPSVNPKAYLVVTPYPRSKSPVTTERYKKVCQTVGGKLFLSSNDNECHALPAFVCPFPWRLTLFCMSIKGAMQGGHRYCSNWTRFCTIQLSVSRNRQTKEVKMNKKALCKGVPSRDDAGSCGWVTFAN